MSFPTSEKPGPYGRVATNEWYGNPDVTRKNHSIYTIKKNGYQLLDRINEGF
jgi:hypothetical protein